MRSTVFEASIVWSVENTRWPVSAAVSAISIVSRSRISPTRITFGAWRSAARSARRERRRVAVQLALVDRALLVRVQELDRILDREDVIGARLVDQVDDRGERRRLARAGRSGHEHDAVLERGDVGERRRQIQLRERRNLRRDDAHDDRVGAALAEDVDAEPGAVRDARTTKSQAPCSFRARSACSLPPISSRATRAVCSGWSIGDAGNLDADQVAVAFDLRRPAGRENQVADAVARVEHGEDHGGRELGRAFGGRAEERPLQLTNHGGWVGCCCGQSRWSHKPYGVSFTIQGLMPSARSRRTATSSAA